MIPPIYFPELSFSNTMYIFFSIYIFFQPCHINFNILGTIGVQAV